MPGSTPVYGITYPCSGDTIDPTVFADHAQSTQDALNQASLLEDQLLRPPAALVTQPSGAQTITAGVTTVVTYTTVTYDTAGMFNIASPTILTIGQPGTYLANFQLERETLPGSQTSFRAAILLNGVEVAYLKSDESTGAFDPDTPMWVSALMPSLVAGNTVSTNALYTGTTTMTISALLSLTRVSIV